MYTEIAWDNIVFRQKQQIIWVNCIILTTFDTVISVNVVQIESYETETLIFIRSATARQISFGRVRYSCDYDNIDGNYKIF